MRYILMVVLSVVFGNLTAQESEKVAVQKAIETFFEGFHKQDSIQIKSTVSNAILLQTIAQDESGNVKVKNQDFSGFLKSVVGIPKTTKFKEIIKEFSIQIDGPMANAWTPYEFRIDDTFHHCGVNSFQLVNDADKGWQIVYLIDTRRKENCN